jgi:hypothetical protein
VKVHVAFNQGFSSVLADWEAKLLVGSRGFVRARWSDPEGGLHERVKQRHDFGLTADAFEALLASLRPLPEREAWVVDDAPSRLITCVRDQEEVRRSRVLWDEDAEPEFEQAWSGVLARLLPVLIEMGVPSERLTRQ